MKFKIQKMYVDFNSLFFYLDVIVFLDLDTYKYKACAVFE